jgi:hypothetical protein
MSDNDAKTPKAAAKYTPFGSPQEHCSKCAHFLSPDTCEKVRGTVVPGGWCKFFFAK